MSINMPVMLSNRHAHLSREALDILFGKDYELTCRRNLGGGEFASNETIVCKGPKGQLEGVRILGPLRKHTQVEVLRGDCFALGIDVPVRDSGDLADAAKLTIIGPAGCLELEHVAIIAQRHAHINSATAKRLGISNLQNLKIVTEGVRSIVFNNVVAKVADNALDVIHLDIEEGNAAGLNNGDMVELRI
jgi:putative phosphotransacetylase